MTETKRPGKVIGLKVESFREEDSHKNLAIRLADALQKEMNARSDAKEFRLQASRERQKAKEFSNTLILLSEYQRKKKKRQLMRQNMMVTNCNKS